MYDTAGRIVRVKKRVKENTRRRQRRGVYRLSGASVLLLAALVQTAGTVIGRGQTAAQGIFGAMLLQADAGGYVLVGTAAFAAATVLTVICMRLHEHERRKKRTRETKEEDAP